MPDLPVLSLAAPAQPANREGERLTVSGFRITDFQPQQYIIYL